MKFPYFENERKKKQERPCSWEDPSQTEQTGKELLNERCASRSFFITEKQKAVS